MLHAALSAILAGLIATTVGAQEEPGRETRPFRDWVVACDNVLTCTAIGFAGPDAGGAGPFLWLQRPGGGDPAADIVVGLGWGDDAEGLAGGRRAVVRVEGGAAPVEAAGITGLADTGAPVVRIRDEAARRRLARALVEGERVTVSVDGKVLGAVSLSGSSAALRWMDDRQGRAGTVTALAARGARPASAVPAPPAIPVVRLAKTVGKEEQPADLPPALAGRADVQACLEDQADPDGDFGGPAVVQLTAAEWLWSIPCGRGAYNFSAFYIIAARDGTKARSPGLAGYDPDVLVNSGLGGSVLSAFGKGRGIGDCGEMASWGWDGRNFVLLDRFVMEDCQGVPHDLWPRLHAAKAG